MICKIFKLFNLNHIMIHSAILESCSESETHDSCYMSHVLFIYMFKSRICILSNLHNIL